MLIMRFDTHNDRSTMILRLDIESRISPVLITLEKTDTGWIVSADTSQNLECKENGYPGLFEILDTNMSINYPHRLPEFISSCWMALNDGVPINRVQSAMTEYANWVSSVDKSYPRNIDLSL